MSTLLFLIVTLRYRCLPLKDGLAVQWEKHAAFDGVSEQSTRGGKAGQHAVHGAGLATVLPDVGLLSALKKDSPAEPVPSTGGCLLLSSAPSLRESQTGSECGLFRHWRISSSGWGLKAADDKLTSWILLVIVVCINETHGLISLSLCPEASITVAFSLRHSSLSVAMVTVERWWV